MVSQIIKASSRGVTKLDWLNSAHTFSFGDYYDPNRMGFGFLRVINDDYVASGRGFGTHPHRDMEIVTFILDGKLAHKDSMGNGSEIVSGDVQHMSAGTGITHSEFNPDPEHPVHLLQIWILPRQKGLTPSYGQKSFLSKRGPGKLTLLLSPDASNESLTIYQDIWCYVLDLNEGQSYTLPIEPGLRVYTHVARGKVDIGSDSLSSGDAMINIDASEVRYDALETSELLIFVQK